MQYEIQLAAVYGNVVPLLAVASAMAKERATAGRTPFHASSYTGAYEGFASTLLREAKSGRLKVCDQWGSQGTADELVSRAEADGTLMRTSRFIPEPDWERLRQENRAVLRDGDVWDFSHLDLGPTVPDCVTTQISALYTMLTWLNEWGESRGDQFAVIHDGEWIDERGVQGRRTELRHAEAGGATAGEPSRAAAADQGSIGDARALEGWKMRVQAEAAAEWNRLRAMNCNPTRGSIRPHLVRWCKANDVKTDSGINPSDGYLRTHVLSAKHWTPPNN